MAPLIPIALQILPSLARTLAGPDKTEAIDRVIAAMRDVLGGRIGEDAGTDEIEALFRTNPELAAELRIRLAEIEAATEERRLQADHARREAERQQQKDALEAMLARMESRRQTEAQRQDALFRDLEARLHSQSDARDKAAKAMDSGSVYQYGPILMSTIVTVGFFVLLYMLIRGTLAEENQAVLQIINIGFGTLTAGFATVISFWLGSSESSRQKDGVNVTLQRQRSEDTREILQRQTEATQAIIERQSSQTEQLIRKVDRATPVLTMASAMTPPPGDRAGKGPRHFQTCVNIIFDHEGGFVNDPDDPGRATNMGITQKTLSAWRGVEVTPDDVAALDRDEAQQIYRANYWNALGCQDLPAGVDLAVFDFAVNSGVRTAAMALQQAVAVEADGEIGPVTLGAVAQFATRDLLEDLRQLRKQRFESRPHFDKFGVGWMRRLERTHAAAKDMARV